MISIRVSLDHSAITPSGMGHENFRIREDKRVKAMYFLTLYTDRLNGTSSKVEISMDAVTMFNLGTACTNSTHDILNDQCSDDGGGW